MKILLRGALRSDDHHMTEINEYVDEASAVEIDDPIAYDAIDDPLRWRLWNQLQRPLSVRQLSEAVGVPAGRLYYHLDRLARHGWVEVAEERAAKTRPERVWRATRSGYRLTGAAAEAASSHPASGAELGVIDDLAHDISGAALADDDVVYSLELVVRGAGFLDQAQASQLRRELIQLAGRFFPDNDTGLPRRDGESSGDPRRFYRLGSAVSSWG